MPMLIGMPGPFELLIMLFLFVLPVAVVVWIIISSVNSRAKLQRDVEELKRTVEEIKDKL